MPIQESVFERKLIKEIERMFPGAITLKVYPNYIQGFPDRLILYQNMWAAFEAKREITSSHRPNQDYYVRLLNRMSFAKFVYPENKEVFLDELQRTFGTLR